MPINSNTFVLILNILTLLQCQLLCLGMLFGFLMKVVGFFLSEDIRKGQEVINVHCLNFNSVGTDFSRFMIWRRMFTFTFHVESGHEFFRAKGGRGTWIQESIHLQDILLVSSTYMTT